MVKKEPDGRWIVVVNGKTVAGPFTDERAARAAYMQYMGQQTTASVVDTRKSRS